VGGVDVFVRKYRPDLPEGLRLQGTLLYNWNISANGSHQKRRQTLAKNRWYLSSRFPAQSSLTSYIQLAKKLFLFSLDRC